MENTDNAISEEDYLLSKKKKEGLNIINSSVSIEDRSERVRPEMLSFDISVPFMDNSSPVKVITETRHEEEHKANESDIGFVFPNIDIETFTEKKTETEEVTLPKPEKEKDIPKEPSPDTSFGDNYGGRETSPYGKFVYENGESEEKTGVPFYKIIGEGFASYIIVELEDRLLFIDKHAAHERMIFEELKSNMKKKKNVLQFLLMPVSLSLDSIETATVNEYFDEISAIGYEIRWEEGGKAMLYAVPIGLQIDEAVDLFMSVCSRLGSGEGSAALSKDILFEKALYQASCKAAIKAGRPDAPEDTKELVRKLMSLPNIKYCPHGRPVAFEVTKDTLEKQFKRK